MSSSQDLTAQSAPDTGASTNAQASQEAARLGRAYHARGNVNIIVDSCADFAPEVAQALGVEVIGFPDVIERYRAELAGPDTPVYVISAATREGCEELVKALAQFIDEARRESMMFLDDERFDPTAD